MGRTLQRTSLEDASVYFVYFLCWLWFLQLTTLVNKRALFYGKNSVDRCIV